jgi:hypothetical protein
MLYYKLVVAAVFSMVNSKEQNSETKGESMSWSTIVPQNHDLLSENNIHRYQRTKA